VEVVVPWGPGGGADILGRLVARWLETDFKVPFPVINMPGATGTIGLQKMVERGGDAHAIDVLTGDTLTMAAFADSPFKLGEVVALGLMICQPSGLFAKGDGRSKSWEDVIAVDKAKPGGITVPIIGANSPAEATVNYLGSKGLKLVGVLYARPGERYTSVLGGQVELLYEQAGDIKGKPGVEGDAPADFLHIAALAGAVRRCARVGQVGLRHPVASDACDRRQGGRDQRVSGGTAQRCGEMKSDPATGRSANR